MSGDPELSHLCWLDGWMESGQSGASHCALAPKTTTPAPTSSSLSGFSVCFANTIIICKVMWKYL